MAVTATWNGATADWNTPTDWSDGIVPNDTNTNAILGGVGSYTVTISAPLGSPESFTTSTVLLNDKNATLDTFGALTTAAMTVDAGTLRVESGATLVTSDLELHNGGTAVINGNYNNSGNINVDTGGNEGGSSLTITGTLNNTGGVQVGPNNQTLGAADTITLGGLTNASKASFFVYGSASHQATLAFSGGTGFSSNAGDFELYHAAPLTLNNAFTNSGNFQLHNGSTLTVMGDFGNSSSLLLDGGGNEGGSSLTITGTLNNTGGVQVGPNNQTLGAADTITLGGLTNASKASFFVYGSASHQATLAFSGGTGFSSNAGDFELYHAAPLTLNNAFTNSGNFQLHNGSTLTVMGDFGNSSSLLLDGGGNEGGSSLTITGTLNNTGGVQVGPNNQTLGAADTITLGGLTNASKASFFVYGSASHQATLAFSGGTGFSSNAGDFELYHAAPLTLNNAFTNSGNFQLHNGSTLTVMGDFGNSSSLLLDGGGNEGGSSLTITGTLNNTGGVQVGPNNQTLGAADTITLGGLTNASKASFFVYGSASHQATLAFSGGTGFSSNAGDFELYHAAPLTLNNAFTNSGNFQLHNGSTLTVMGDFGNSSSLLLDGGGNEGGSSLTITGTLNNTGGVQVGPNNQTLGAADTITLGGLTNASKASFFVYGSASHQATLAFSGGTGFSSNAGDFELYHAAPLTLNNAFTNSGNFQLHNGSTLTVMGDFGNSSSLLLDGGGNEGGSSLTITGTLNNTGGVQVGPNNQTLGAADTITLGGLTNASKASFFVYGSASHQATLAFSGGTGFSSNAGDFELYHAAPLTLNNAFTNSGNFQLHNGSTLTVMGDFGNSSSLLLDGGGNEGGSSLTITGTLNNTGGVQVGPNNQTLGAADTITLGGLTNASKASFFVYGSASHQATLAFSGGTGFSSNAGDFELYHAAPLTLNNAFTNSGNFQLHNGSTLTVMGDFGNSSSLLLDGGGNEGGSSLTITGTLNNTGGVQVGPNNQTLGAADTITLGGLTNASKASFFVYGSASHQATLILNGLATNSGIFVIGSFAVLDVASTGTLVATGGSKIDISAGTLTNLSGTTLTGGAYEADAGSTIQLPNNATVVTLAASLTLNGLGSVVESLNTPIENTLTAIAVGGALNVLGGRSYTTTNTITDAGTLQIGGGGKFDLSNGGLANLSGTTLAGGTYVVDAGSTLQLPNNATIVTLAADLTLNGTGSVVESLNKNTNTQVPLEQTLTTIGATGALRVLGGRGYTTANAITDDGNLQLGGGTFAAASLTIDAGGTLSGFGTVADVIANSGTVDAAGGELILAGGFSGSGTYKIEAGATLDLTGGGALPTITGPGTLQLDGGTFTDTLALENIGSVAVDAGATLSVVAGSSLSLGSPMTVSGTLSNAGTISGGVTFGSAPPPDRLILYPGAKFTGTVAGGGANSTIELAMGSVAGTLNALGTEFTNFGTVTVDAGANWTVDALASALTGVALIGNDTASTLKLISPPGTFSLGGVRDFSQVYLAAGNNTLTVTDPTLSGGSVTFRDGASGNNKIDATGDTVASKGKTLIWLTGSGTDTLTGGFEIAKVYVTAAAVGGDTFTGGGNTANALVLTTPGNANLGGVSNFSQVYLAAGNTVTVTDTTLSGGPVTFRDGTSGNNKIDATGDTVASKGKTLIWLTGSGTDTLTGGFEIDKVYVSAAAVGGDTFTGGGNTANALVLTTPGNANLGGVKNFSQVYLAAGNTVTVTDNTLSGGSVTFRDGTSGNNKIDATTDTAASKAKTLIWLAGSGTDRLAGGSEIDKVYVTAAAVGTDTFTAGGNTANALVLTTPGNANLGGVSNFSQVYLPAGNTITPGSTVTVTDTTLSSGSVTFRDGTSGNNRIDATGATASQTKTLIWLAGSGTDSLAGGSEIDKVYVTAKAVGGDTFTGGGNTANALVLTSTGSANLGGVSKFSQVYLSSGNTVTVANTTLSGVLPVTFRDGASGDNSIDATGDTAASQGKTLIWLTGSGKDSLTGGFEIDKVYASAKAVGGDTFTGGSNTANALLLTTPGSANLGGVKNFSQVYLAAGNTVTVTDPTLSGGTVTFRDGASGDNSIDATGDTLASKGKTLIWLTGSGKDSLAGGFEIDKVYVTAAAVGGDTFTGGSNPANALVLTTPGNANLGGVKNFSQVYLAAGNTATVTDPTLWGGTVTFRDGASGNNKIDATGDTVASKGKTLTWLVGSGKDSFTGGFENDKVYVTAAAVGGDTFAGGSGTNVLVLTTPGSANLGGVSNFSVVYLAAGNTITPGSTVTVTDTTLSGGSVTFRDGASGNNSIDATGATASQGKTLTWLSGSGTDTFTGGSENDTIYAGTGLGNYTVGSGTDLFIYSAAADSPFVPGSGGAADDTINGFSANDEVSLKGLLLSHKSVLDKGVVGSFTDAAAPGYFGSAGAAVEYGAGNTAQAYIDANNNGNLDTGDMMIKFTSVTPGSLDHNFLM